MSADKPAVHLNLDTLEREDKPDPFSFVLGGERFECKDPKELDYRAFRDMNDPEGQFKLLLPPNKFESFKKHTLTLWKQQRLVNTALEHYGLGDTSASPGS